MTIDGSDRDAILDKLRRSEARLREAQRIAHVGSWEWDVVANHVLWTDELYRIYGIGKVDFDGTYEAFLNRVPPGERETTNSFLFNAFQKAKPRFEYDHHIVRGDGKVRLLRTVGETASNEEGKVVRMTGACWDVTDLSEATQGFERSISLLRASLESTADGLLIVERDGKIAAFNQRLCDLWQIPRSAVEGRNFAELLDRVHSQLDNAAACLQTVRRMEAEPEAESFDRLDFFDGHTFERYSRPQRVAGRVVGRVWSYRDVSERERLLRHSQFLAKASKLLATDNVERALDGIAQLALSVLGETCAVDMLRDGKPQRLLRVFSQPQRPIPDGISAEVRNGKSVIVATEESTTLAVPILARGNFLGAIAFARSVVRPFGSADIALAAELALQVGVALELARLHGGGMRETRSPSGNAD